MFSLLRGHFPPTSGVQVDSSVTYPPGPVCEPCFASVAEPLPFGAGFIQ